MIGDRRGFGDFAIICAFRILDEEKLVCVNDLEDMFLESAALPLLLLDNGNRINIESACKVRLANVRQLLFVLDARKVGRPETKANRRKK